MNLDLLKQLSEAPGVPGREECVRAILEPLFREAFDDVSTDAMGNLIGTKRSGKAGAKRVLIAAHIDEIGFYVRHIDDKGYLRITNVGGFDTRNLLARRVLVQASHGGDLVGLLNPAGRPIHIAKDEEKKKIPEIGEFFVDLCLPADQVKAKVRVGDPVTLIQECLVLGETVTGKCLDNRVSAWVVLEAMKKVTNLSYDLTVVATVQEEVGLRGAGPAAFSAEPHIAIALDTTLCCDTPGVPEDERVTQFGAGVAIKVMDGASIGDRATIDSLLAAAESKQIPHQLALLPRGGTDSGAMQRVRGGVKTATLGIPTRYIHTVTECVHQRDLQSAIDLLAAWLSG